MSAILTLDPEEARAATHLEGATLAELARHPIVRERATAAVTKANGQLARFEQIRRFRILDRELSVAADDLTPTMKLRRKSVSEKLAAEIDSLYQEKLGSDVIEVVKAGAEGAAS